VVNKKQVLFLNLILLQVFLSCYLGISYLNRSIDYIFEVPAVIISIIVLFIGLLCLLTVKELLRLARKEKEAEVALARLEENKTLIETLKAKQHDFANHLQVIYGLIHRGKKDEVKKYMQDMSEDLKTLERVAGLKRAEVAALICKKMTLSGNVTVEPYIESNLDGLSLPPDKMVSILGNLLDNAIYEAEYQDEGFNKVSVRIAENEDWYIFEVWNPGHIPAELQPKIFQPGFTTKGEKGSGMGLHIVRNIVDQYGGRLEFTSDEKSGTKFRVELPKQDQTVKMANRGF